MSSETIQSRTRALFAERFRPMSAVNWLSMSAEEQLEALRTAPPVALSWHEPRWDAHCWYRAISIPHIGKAAFVRSTAEGWGVTVCSPRDLSKAAHLGFYKTAEEAKAVADRELRRTGWRMIP